MWYYILILLLLVIVYQIYSNISGIILLSKYLYIRYGSFKVPESTVFHEADKFKIIKIYYNYKGSIYSVLLPLYTPGYSFIGTKHYLVKKPEIINIDDTSGSKFEEIDITQQIGLQYYVNPDMLGAEKILAKKHDEVLREYIGESFPQISKK